MCVCDQTRVCVTLARQVTSRTCPDSRARLDSQCVSGQVGKGTARNKASPGSEAADTGARHAWPHSEPPSHAGTSATSAAPPSRSHWHPSIRCPRPQGLAIHPGTSKHLLVLTADRFLRAYDIFSRLTEPVAAFELSLDPTPPPPSRILLHGPSSQPNALQFCPEPLGKDAQHAALAICDGSLHLLSVPIQALSSAAPLTQSAGSFPMGTARITPLGSVSVSGTSLLGAGFSCCTHGVFALAVLRDSFSGSLSVCAVPVRWDASLGVRADLPREGPLVPLRLSFPQGEALAASVDPKRLSFFVTAGSGGNGEVPHGGATRSTGKGEDARTGPRIGWLCPRMLFAASADRCVRRCDLASGMRRRRHSSALLREAWRHLAAALVRASL